MNKRVLVLAGTGVFGARLCSGLVADGWEVTVAARTPAPGVVRIDRDAPDLSARIAAQAPFAVVDAAGPFQAYRGTPVVQAALAAGAHYLDLSDDADFCAAVAEHDAAFRESGLAALSGVSSVPALSGAAVAALREGMEDIHLIDSVILPGNRAPRGVSVIRAILAQIGRPLPGGGRGWAGLSRVALPLPGHALPPRWASPIGAPDLTLFPGAFQARTVRFRAGLELAVMHLGLAALAPLGRVLPLTPLARPLRWLADLLRGFGTDRGGMRVRVVGLAGGRPVCRDWLLVAEGGDGPQVPTVPARAMLARIAAGQVAPGAHPCVADLPLAEAEGILRRYRIATGRLEARAAMLFADHLGAAFLALPAPVQALHQVLHRRRWQGRAAVTRGTGRLARLIARAMRFPPADPDMPVTVTMERRGETEVWTRDFDGHRFRSHLRRQGPAMTERFGPMRFTIALTVRDGALCYPVTAGRIFGIPIPGALLPVSDTREVADTEGRASFDVALSHPWTGPIIRYRGWLVPADQSAK